MGTSLRTTVCLGDGEGSETCCCLRGMYRSGLCQLHGLDKGLGDSDERHLRPGLLQRLRSGVQGSRFASRGADHQAGRGGDEAAAPPNNGRGGQYASGLTDPQATWCSGKHSRRQSCEVPRLCKNDTARTRADRKARPSRNALSGHSSCQIVSRYAGEPRCGSTCLPGGLSTHPQGDQPAHPPTGRPVAHPANATACKLTYAPMRWTGDHKTSGHVGLQAGPYGGRFPHKVTQGSVCKPVGLSTGRRTYSPDPEPGNRPVCPRAHLTTHGPTDPWPCGVVGRSAGRNGSPLPHRTARLSN
ncbi:hypothetical protein K377_08110 [Streptomyces sp. PsTaAH-137]|nr:hypothetical protein K377_08110 [Streptomyces sp. PsTaAH-137]